MRRLTAMIVTVAVASVLASASLLASPRSAMAAACYYSGDKTATNTITQQGATITSTVEYLVGYGCAGNITVLRIFSMKLKVVVGPGWDGPFMRTMRLDSNDNFPFGPNKKYWEKIYNEPYPGCSGPGMGGDCSFTKKEYLPSGFEVPYSSQTVAFYGGSFFPLTCVTNVVHKFVLHSIKIHEMCSL